MTKNDDWRKPNVGDPRTIAEAVSRGRAAIAKLGITIPSTAKPIEVPLAVPVAVAVEDEPEPEPTDHFAVAEPQPKALARLEAEAADLAARNALNRQFIAKGDRRAAKAKERAEAKAAAESKERARRDKQNVLRRAKRKAEAAVVPTADEIAQEEAEIAAAWAEIAALPDGGDEDGLGIILIPVDGATEKAVNSGMLAVHACKARTVRQRRLRSRLASARYRETRKEQPSRHLWENHLAASLAEIETMDVEVIAPKLIAQLRQLRGEQRRDPNRIATLSLVRWCQWELSSTSAKPSLAEIATSFNDKRGEIPAITRRQVERALSLIASLKVKDGPWHNSAPTLHRLYKERLTRCRVIHDKRPESRA